MDYERGAAIHYVGEWRRHGYYWILLILYASGALRGEMVIITIDCYDAANSCYESADIRCFVTMMWSLLDMMTLT